MRSLLLILIGYMSKVLILVLMEYAQWDIKKELLNMNLGIVLILVLMEYAQWERDIPAMAFSKNAS